MKDDVERELKLMQEFIEEWERNRPPEDTGNDDPDSCLGPVSKAYRAIERHARKRLRQWLCAKHKLRGQATKQFSITALHQVLGLVELTTRTSSFPWASS